MFIQIDKHSLTETSAEIVRLNKLKSELLEKYQTDLARLEGLIALNQAKYNYIVLCAEIDRVYPC